ncbi:MAG: ABC transporter permease, partial [Chloroflexi bacterium]|nr:ABC transporter permease [Chloroflexota bacterium]
VIVPSDYGKSTLDGKPAKLIFIGDTASPAGTTIQSEIISAASRLDSAVRTALIMEEVAKSRTPFDYAFKPTLDAWHKPPIAVKETTSAVIRKDSEQVMSLAHTSPGMMLQFAIAGLLTAAQVIVAERKSRAMQRLLTTATARLHILLGHYLAIFSLIFTQFIILILFGQLLLKVDYLRDVPATFLVAFTSALCIAAMGLLIGTLAHSDEQAVIFSLIPMFVFSGLGGAWVPLEVTGATFQTIGHISPVAWALDGFKNIITRGFGINSVLLPAAALIVYGGIFFTLAAWRLHRAED